LSQAPEPVLVAGAGATGLTMACELARHGVAVRIVDRLPGIVRLARATGVHSRTLEVFQDFGIADEIVAKAALIRGARQFAGGELMLHLRSEDLDSPFPFSASLEQWKVEEALEALLGRLGVSVERETELVTFEESDQGVRATLRQVDGTSEMVETPWLIGCDGAHSTVRHLKGEQFPGEVDPRRYIVADVVLDDTGSQDEVHVHLTDHGALWWFPLPEGRSLIAADAPGESEDPMESPCLEDLQALLDARAPHAIRARDPRWLSWFHIHYRLTPHYHHGRTFLAGDAAHIHSPIGGQGMNTGIQDAYNLAWKLALVVRGLAAESLLDSYQAERHAVAEDVLTTTRRLTEHAERYVTVAPEDRTHMYAHMVLPEAQRLKIQRHNEELDLDYRRSNICRDAVTEAAASGGGPHAGAEARDARPLLAKDTGTTLFELLRGPHHTLLLLPGLEAAGRVEPVVLEALAEEVASSFGDLVRVLLALPPDADDADFAGVPATLIRDVEGELHRRYGASASRQYLVRPDGYVGFRSEPPLREPLFDFLGQVLAVPVAS